MNFLQKFRDFVFSPSHSRTMGVLLMLVLVSAVGLTITISQQQQTLKQHASGNCHSSGGECYNGTSCPSNQDHVVDLDSSCNDSESIYPGLCCALKDTESCKSVSGTNTSDSHCPVGTIRKKSGETTAGDSRLCCVAGTVPAGLPGCDDHGAGRGGCNAMNAEDGCSSTACLSSAGTFSGSDLASDGIKLVCCPISQCRDTLGGTCVQGSKGFDVATSDPNYCSIERRQTGTDCGPCCLPATATSAPPSAPTLTCEETCEANYAGETLLNKCLDKCSTPNPAPTACSSAGTCDSCTNYSLCGWNGTSCVAYDDSKNLTQICQEQKQWRYVDCAIDDCAGIPAPTSTLSGCQKDSDCNKYFNPCITDKTCNVSTGLCNNKPVSDGTACENGYTKDTGMYATKWCCSGACGTDSTCGGGSGTTPLCDSTPDCSNAVCSSTCLTSGTKTCNFIELSDGSGKACTKTPTTQPCNKIDCGSTKTCNASGICEDQTQKSIANLFACNGQAGAEYMCGTTTTCGTGYAPYAGSGTDCGTNLCCKKIAAAGDTIIQLPANTSFATLFTYTASKELLMNKDQNITVYLYPSTVDPSADSLGNSAAYKQTGVLSASTGTTSFNLGQVTPGAYKMLLKAPQYLRVLEETRDISAAGGTLALTLNKNLVSGVGDTNNDNVLDPLDYNAILDCTGKRPNSVCANKAGADLNNDGVVDQIDYSIFLKSLSYARRSGD